MKNNKGIPYFRHYADMSQREEIKRLRQKTGMAGYGVYLMLLEKFSESETKMCTLNFKTFCFDFDCNKDLLRSVLFDFGLFNVRIIDERIELESVELVRQLKNRRNSISLNK